MIENEPETMTAAPRIGADFVENSTRFKSSRRQPNPPAAAVTAAPVQIKTPEAVFSAAVRAINKRYRPGTLEHVRDRLPGLAEEMAQAFDRVNMTWERWIPGADLEPFKRALRSWYNLNIKAIELFQEIEK